MTFYLRSEFGMLVTKFIVPVTRKIYTDIFKFASRNRRCNNKIQRIRLQNVKKEKISAKCEEYQEKLAKCPKPCSDNLCSKKLSSESTPKCEMKSTIDNYQKAYEDVTNRSNTILDDIQNKSRFILDQLTKDIEILKNSEQMQLQGFLDDIKKTLQRLLVIDPSCGSLKRKCAMSLSYQIRQATNNAECDIVPQTKRVKEITDNLERDIFVNTDRAKSLILSCKKCKNSQALAKCVEENAIYAEKILDKTSKNARIGLHKVEELQREILKHHKRLLTEISQTYRKESEGFLEHLNNCIFHARNKKKR